MEYLYSIILQLINNPEFNYHKIQIYSRSYFKNSSYKENIDKWIMESEFNTYIRNLKTKFNLYQFKLYKYHNTDVY